MTIKAVKPRKKSTPPLTVFHSFDPLFISAKVSQNLIRYTEKDRASVFFTALFVSYTKDFSPEF